MAPKNQQLKRRLFTLSIVHRHPKILLGMKKRGFGQGRWNGFGGKVESGETLEGAAKREIEEESGIQAERLTELGKIDFQFLGKSEILEVHIFRSDSFSGRVTESEEMKPRWFDVSEIPFEQMWPDDKYWLPLFLAGKKFEGRFLFDDSDNILEEELVEVKT